MRSDTLKVEAKVFMPGITVSLDIKAAAFIAALAGSYREGSKVCPRLGAVETVSDLEHVRIGPAPGARRGRPRPCRVLRHELIRVDQIVHCAVELRPDVGAKPEKVARALVEHLSEWDRGRVALLGVPLRETVL